MPSIVSEPKSWRNQRKELSGSLGFVPTMGNLHAGHISLCEQAKRENDFVLASIFVNPTQFNQREDFDAYARTLEADCKLLDEAGVDFVFVPDEKTMYPDKYEVQVIEGLVSGELEGEFRPGHFQGMLTIVLKLLNIAQADRAYFGEKDFQQLTLVRKMADSLFLPVEIVAGKTVRAEDGLALSSRNARLTPEQRQIAPTLARLLKSGLDDAAVMKKLEEAGFRPEYVASKWGRRLAAAWLGDVRLIDNVPLSEVKKEEAA
ncbi:MAG: pantoate--beta-alanine ligase [Alphaproteobacteria bacterium]|nr:pantoate--beta-alanine ligase [Alphaproteobacteria bacterium]